MKMQDVLFKETLIRVGHSEMAGIARLIEEGHTGIAERHTVSKLIMYVRELEKKLGMDVPKVKDLPSQEGVLKINGASGSYYTPRVN